MCVLCSCASGVNGGCRADGAREERERAALLRRVANSSLIAGDSSVLAQKLVEVKGRGGK